MSGLLHNRTPSVLIRFWQWGFSSDIFSIFLYPGKITQRHREVRTLTVWVTINFSMIYSSDLLFAGEFLLTTVGKSSQLWEFDYEVSILFCVYSPSGFIRVLIESYSTCTLCTSWPHVYRYFKFWMSRVAHESRFRQTTAAHIATSVMLILTSCITVSIFATLLPLL